MPRVKYLCAGCNNGWMSNLETAVRPLMGAMINDLAVLLDRDQQQLIATWALKTAMVFECMNDTGEWFYSQADRRHLLTILSPPAKDTIIWLGRHQGSRQAFAEGKKLSGGKPIQNVALGEGSVMTLALGHLAIQVFTMKRRPEHQAIPITLNIKPGKWDASLIQIWPTVPAFRWPPRLSFDGAGLDRLSNRFTAPPSP